MTAAAPSTLELRPQDGELWGFITDSHYPIHHVPTIGILLNVFEAAGVKRAIHGGDLADFHGTSNHKKDPERMVRDGFLSEQLAPAEPLLDWMRARRGLVITGNHDARPERMVADKWPELLELVRFGALPQLKGLTVIPWGGRIRVGSYVLEHGDYLFPRSIPANPAVKVLADFPDQTTIFGHIHRRLMALRTVPNQKGRMRTRGAISFGHSSRVEAHAGYAGRSPNWQLGGGLIRWHYPEGERGSPQAEITQLEIWEGKRGKYYTMWNGSVWR